MTNKRFFYLKRFHDKKLQKTIRLRCLPRVYTWLSRLRLYVKPEYENITFILFLLVLPAYLKISYIFLLNLRLEQSKKKHLPIKFCPV